MKIAQINITCGKGSTGKICVAISELLTEKNIENIIFYSSDKSEYSLGNKYMSATEIKFQALKSRIFGNYGFQSKQATKRLINELKEFSPDIVHLHNLHSHNVHLEMLFSYLKENNIKIFWTFHDCWAFTGYCPHYDMIKCEQWKVDGCHKCPQRKRFSWFFDRSRYLYKKKKEIFTGVDLTIITPSQWLADQVKQSLFKDCELKVINNGIDLSVFYPRESDFRKKYNIEEKFIILGVAFDWGVRKGLDVFIELSKKLDDRFRIVLVGTNEKIDKQLPENIISIHRTQNQIELSEIYTSADLFINPTREENFPTTHLESMACGTPVVAFDTGGCKEMLNDICGCVVEKNNIQNLCEKILEIEKQRPFLTENCIKKASEYCDENKFQEYISLYC